MSCFSLPFRVPSVDVDESWCRNYGLKHLLYDLLFGKPVDVEVDDALLGMAILLLTAVSQRFWARALTGLAEYYVNSCVGEGQVAVVDAMRRLGVRVEHAGDVLCLGTWVVDSSEFGGNVTKCTQYFAGYYVVHWVDYLRLVSRELSHEPKWKLVNRRPVVRGWVLVEGRELRRLLQEAVFNHLMEKLSRGSERVRQFMDYIPQCLIDYAKKLNDKAEEAVRSRVTVHVRGGATPPCIEAIINDIKNGGNPSHFARFTVATYLLHKCKDSGREITQCVNEVVELFRTVADFDEKVTRYQVEHLAGLRGGRKFYMTPSCEEIHTNNLCPTNLGCGIKNPLQFRGKQDQT